MPIPGTFFRRKPNSSDVMNTERVLHTDIFLLSGFVIPLCGFRFVFGNANTIKSIQPAAVLYFGGLGWLTEPIHESLCRRSGIVFCQTDRRYESDLYENRKDVENGKGFVRRGWFPSIPPSDTRRV